MPFELPTMEIKLNNLCNLKCRMCNPLDSTSWKDWDQVTKFYKKEDNIPLESIVRNMNDPVMAMFEKPEVVPETDLVDVQASMEKAELPGSKLGKNFNTSYTGTGATVDIDTETTKKITKATNVNLFTSQNSNDTAAALKRELGKVPGIKITQSSKGKFKATKVNKITISKPGAEDLIINSNETEADAELQAKNLKDWLTANLTDEDKQALAGQKTGGNKAP
jgi:hypothetical protein